MSEQALAAARRSLHAVAELVIAGPQQASTGDIRLRVVPGGFAGTVSGVRVDGAELVWSGGRTPLAGTCHTLAAAAGVTAVAPDAYQHGSGVDPDEQLVLDPEATALLLGWFARGDAALQAFAPGAERVLWPEHFDVGYALDGVNYGVSPGDDGHPAPYAYVGPWTRRDGPFWNAPFGAACAAAQLPEVADVVDFFRRGRSEAARV
ncbi:MAG: hypothetical protein ACJ710_15935 [Ornithinibacter sp.]